MPITMFSFVGLHDRTLGSLAHLLDKGADLPRRKGFDAESILDWRLIDDMQPLRFQAEVATARADRYDRCVIVPALFPDQALWVRKRRWTRPCRRPNPNSKSRRCRPRCPEP